MWRLRQPSCAPDTDACTPCLCCDPFEDHWEDASVSINVAADPTRLQPWSSHAPDDSFLNDTFEPRGAVSAASLHPSSFNPAEEVSAQTRRRSTFPPPIATCATLAFKEQGRLVLKEVSARPHSFVRAERGDGRLRLQLIEPSAIEDEGGSEDLDSPELEDRDAENESPPSLQVEGQEDAAVCSREDACIEKLDSLDDDDAQEVSDFDEWRDDYESDGKEESACPSSYESQCIASPNLESPGAVRECRCPAIAHSGSRGAGDFDEHGGLSLDREEMDASAHDSSVELPPNPNASKGCQQSLLTSSMGSKSAKFTGNRDNENQSSSQRSTVVESGSGKMAANAVIDGNLENASAMIEFIRSPSLSPMPSPSFLLLGPYRSLTLPLLPSSSSSLLSPCSDKCDADTTKTKSGYCKQGKIRDICPISGRQEVGLRGDGGGCRDHLVFGGGMGGWTASNGRSKSSDGSSKVWSPPPQLVHHPSLCA